MAVQSRELAIPFRIDADGGIATSTSREDILIAHVVSVLGTQPTERVMRPTFGCDIQQFAFDLGDLINETALNDTVRAALEQWAPEVRFMSLHAQPPNQDGLFIVAVRFADAVDPRANPLEAVLEFAVEGEAGGA